MYAGPNEHNKNKEDIDSDDEIKMQRAEGKMSRISVRESEREGHHDPIKQRHPSNTKENRSTSSSIRKETWVSTHLHTDACPVYRREHVFIQ